jgi:hypothetical protein
LRLIDISVISIEVLLLSSVYTSIAVGCRTLFSVTGMPLVGGVSASSLLSALSQTIAAIARKWNLFFCIESWPSSNESEEAQDERKGSREKT